MKNVEKYVGNPDQLYSVIRTRMEEGRGNGNTVYRVTTGGRLQYEVLPDTGLDLGSVTYQGYNITFFGKSGLVSPNGYLPFGMEFNHTFNGGLCYTCGLLNVGDPCEDEGETHPLHGRYHFHAADQVCGSVKDDALVVSGRVREGTLFGENLEVQRTITSPVGSSEIILRDKITNQRPVAQPVMLLYHCNLGYPFLSPALSIVPPASVRVTAVDDFAESELDKRLTVIEPEIERPEQVFSYDLDPAQKTAEIRLENAHLGIGLAMQWNTDVLPIMTQWRSMRTGDYAMAIEPGTNYVYGCRKAREEGTLRMLPPYESLETELRFRFYSL